MGRVPLTEFILLGNSCMASIRPPQKLKQQGYHGLPRFAQGQSMSVEVA